MPSPQRHLQSHPDFYVESLPGAFNSGLRSKKAFAADAILAKLEGLTRAPKAYTSVQCGRGTDDHVELNSEFVYINHSCQPNVAFDLSSDDKSDWQIRALKPINVGDALTFFYPSTEWDMEQPFECRCKESTCLEIIKGASHLSLEDLTKRGFINRWILELVSERDMQDSAQTAGKCLNCGFGYSLDGNVQWCGCQR